MQVDFLKVRKYLGTKSYQVNKSSTLLFYHLMYIVVCKVTIKIITHQDITFKMKSLTYSILEWNQNTFLA